MPKPAGSSVTGVPLACEVLLGSNVVWCPLGDIAPTDGVPVYVFYNVEIDADVPAGTVLTNDADVLQTDTPDPDPSNNSVDTTITDEDTPDLQPQTALENRVYRRAKPVGELHERAPGGQYLDALAQAEAKIAPAMKAQDFSAAMAAMALSVASGIPRAMLSRTLP